MTFKKIYKIARIADIKEDWLIRVLQLGLIDPVEAFKKFKMKIFVSECRVKEVWPAALSFFLQIAVILALVAASSTFAAEEPEIISQTNPGIKSNGAYNYQFETKNKITGQEESDGSRNIKGSYSYYATDGNRVLVTYEAGPAIGFVPERKILNAEGTELFF